ncbi:MAG: aromatic acid decarboxylase, partial [Nitrospirae bacterium]|nr:aromatic acid decarboxylase [Nitrospirota bacterium]
LKLSRIGVKIAPPVLAFYHKPKKIDDMVNFIAGKILDAVGVEHEIYRRWEGSKK